MDLFSMYQKIDNELTVYLDVSKLNTRPNASNGLWVALLLPACLYATALKLPIFHSTTSCSIGLCLASILFVIFIYAAQRKLNSVHSWVIPALLICSVDWFFLHRGFIFSILSGALTSLSFKISFLFILKNCPLSFTIGEALLVNQSIVLFVYSTLINMYSSWHNTPTDDFDIITLILQVGLLTTLLVVLTIYKMQHKMDLRVFIYIVGIYVSAMLIVLHVLLARSSIIWIIMFLLNDLNKIWLVVYWAIASLFGGVAVAGQIFSGSKATTSHRKIFHVLATFVYLTGYIYECNLIYLASGIALAVLIALETVRKLKIGPISVILNEGFVLFADEKDAGGLSLTPLYLLIGMSCPLALRSDSCSSSSLLTAISGLLSVGIGDTCASFFGSNYGKTYWRGSKKSVEGTLANIVSQSAALYFMSAFGFIGSGVWITLVCISAVLTNAVIEAVTDQVDNLTLPLITYLILLLA